MKLSRVVVLAFMAVMASAVLASPAQAAKRIAEFLLPTPFSGPFEVTAGPDGNIWFTDSANRQVGYMTLTGSVTTFAVTGLGAVDFSGIVGGGDGSVWFTVTGRGTEFGLGALGRVTLDGAVTVTPLGNMGLTGLTRAGDGSLWVLDLDKVHHVLADGSITAIGAPAGWWMVGEPAVGPDGNIWMMGESKPDNATMALFRLAPDGTFSRFGLPSGWMDYSRIAPGPDGALWLTAESRNSVLRVSPRGAVLEEIGVSDSPADITLGPDGRMWFTAFKSIGRISP